MEQLPLLLAPGRRVFGPAARLELEESKYGWADANEGREVL